MSTHMTPDEEAEFKRRRKGRNTALALVLLPTWAGIRDQMAEAGGFGWAQVQEIGWALLLTLETERLKFAPGLKLP